MHFNQKTAPKMVYKEMGHKHTVDIVLKNGNKCTTKYLSTLI